MTEEQAIERIEAAIRRGFDPSADLIALVPKEAATSAWNEIKAIAREDRVTIKFLKGRSLLNGDGTSTVLP